MRITGIFFGVYMGYQFQGLTEYAKAHKTKTDADSIIVFVNKPATAFKVLVGGQYLAYYRQPGKHPIPLEAIAYLPEKFGGTRMEFDKAVREVLIKKLGYKYEQFTNPAIKPG